MDSRRQLKIASVIQEAFTDILTREGKAIYGKAFVTVTNVKVTSDLTLARFYLSIFNTDEPEAVLQRFKDHVFEIKRLMAEKLRHHLRRIPEFEFFRDNTLEYASHIEDVFKKIKEEDDRLREEIENPKPALKPKKATGTKKAAPKKPKG